MKSFEYAAPKTLKEATALLSDTWGKTEILAGGTDLVTSLKQHITTPGRVVSLSFSGELNVIDISKIAGLRDRALIATMIFSFARVSAVVHMRVGDYFQNGKRWWIQSVVWDQERPGNPIPAELLTTGKTGIRPNSSWETGLSFLGK
jgi:hypothetical protein